MRCEQELQLLKGNSERQANFDFSLTRRAQYDHLQAQTGGEFCNRIVPISTTFNLSSTDQFNILLITEKSCISDSSGNIISCLGPPMRSVQVLVNKNAQVLIESNFTNLDSVKEEIVRVSLREFGDDIERKAIYEIDWDEQTPIEARKAVFGGMVDGYLTVANEISLKEFGKELCIIDSSQVEQLKKKFRMVVRIVDRLPPVPPPPKPDERN